MQFCSEWQLRIQNGEAGVRRRRACHGQRFVAARSRQWADDEDWQHSVSPPPIRSAARSAQRSTAQQHSATRDCNRRPTTQASQDQRPGRRARRAEPDGRSERSRHKAVQSQHRQRRRMGSQAELQPQCPRLCTIGGTRAKWKSKKNKKEQRNDRQSSFHVVWEQLRG